MQDVEAQQLLLSLVNHAQQGKFTEFHLIRSWNEFRFYGQNARATKIVIKLLKSATKSLFKEYCNDVTTGSADFNKLLAHLQLQEISEFYEKDLVTIKSMLDEYDDYLGKGHFWYSFLGGEREI